LRLLKKPHLSDAFEEFLTRRADKVISIGFLLRQGQDGRKYIVFNEMADNETIVYADTSPEKSHSS
jgi:hypothetical protein